MHFPLVMHENELREISLFSPVSNVQGFHGGHIGGTKQENDFPLGNKSNFYANIFLLFCTSNMAAAKTL